MDIQFNLIDTGGMTLSQHTENSSMNIEKQILSQCEVAIQVRPEDMTRSDRSVYD